MYAGNVHRNPNIVITFGASQSGHDVSITHLQNGSKYMVDMHEETKYVQIDLLSLTSFIFGLGQ